MEIRRTGCSPDRRPLIAPSPAVPPPTPPAHPAVAPTPVAGRRGGNSPVLPGAGRAHDETAAAQRRRAARVTRTPKHAPPPAARQSPAATDPRAHEAPPAGRPSASLPRSLQRRLNSRSRPPPSAKSRNAERVSPDPLMAVGRSLPSYVPAKQFSAETAVVLAAIGLGVGAFGTLVRAGGGFTLTPILLLLYPHDSAQTLTAISLQWCSSTPPAAPRPTRDNVARLPQRRRLRARDPAQRHRRRTCRRCRLPPDLRREHGGRARVPCSLVARRRAMATPAAAPPPGTPRTRRPQRRNLLLRRSASVPGALQPRRRLPLQLPRHRRRRHPRAPPGPCARFPTHLAPATSHFVLAIMAGTGTVTHIVLGLRPRPPPRAGALDRRRRRRPVRRAHLARLREAAIQWLLAAALLALAVRLL